ncbi:hypothetical protein CHARACLAT_014245 [Characodon lateralis]|uniref:Uncharacterized protein n=1 Tax=Characodon lateralis TaxID=208331 RepID=A0ABU7DUM8_9TELE|nr:hypothetical protein [Characodon lateralis]
MSRSQVNVSSMEEHQRNQPRPQEDKCGPPTSRCLKVQTIICQYKQFWKETCSVTQRWTGSAGNVQINPRTKPKDLLKMLVRESLSTVEHVLIQHGLEGLPEKKKA